MKRSQLSAIDIADRTMMTKRRQECVGGCGENCLFCHPVVHSAPTSFHRLVNIGGQGFDVPELMSVAVKSFPDCYRKLALCDSIRSMSTGDDVAPTIRPTAVITDVRCLLFKFLGAVY